MEDYKGEVELQEIFICGENYSVRFQNIWTKSIKALSLYGPRPVVPRTDDSVTVATCLESYFF